MSLEDLFNFFSQLRPEFLRFILGLIVVLTVAIVYKIFSRSISKIAKKIELDPHIENSLRLILRVVVIVVAASAIFAIFEFDTTWFLGGSALVGAALGFGSSQTINNIVAGFYVILTRPFQVKDYVKIGDVEGQVEEISINYTKLYTPSFNLLLVPNIQVMNSRVLNCTHEGFIKYTFTLDIPHGMVSSNEEIIKRCVEPAIEEFYQKYSGLHIRKPEYYFETSAPIARTFKIRLFIPKGEAKTLYSLKPELTDMIINLWDRERKK
ncbi:MAG: mechanosensitive ion channel [Candidatus Bathyarchaeia archaeon]